MLTGSPFVVSLPNWHKYARELTWIVRITPPSGVTVAAAIRLLSVANNSPAVVVTCRASAVLPMATRVTAIAAAIPKRTTLFPAGWFNSFSDGTIDRAG